MSNLQQILPEVLALITGYPRYKSEIIWSDKSWTQNVFNCFEIVFWRRFGPRLENYTDIATGIEYGVSLRGKIAVFETKVRNSLTRLASVRVLVHQLSLINPFIRIPIGYSFAIAFDNSATTGTSGASPQTVSITATGSNLVMAFDIACTGVFLDNSNAASYAGNAATKRSTQADTGLTIGTACAIWTLKHSTTGSNTASVGSSVGNLLGRILSISGANDFDAQNSGKTTSVTSISPSITTIADNSWLTAIMGDGGTNPSIGSGYTEIGTVTNVVLAGYATAQTPAGAHSPQLATGFTSSDVVWCVVSISPAGGAVANGNFLMFM